MKRAYRDALICLLLVGCTLVTYWPARHYDFVNYDDEDGIVGTPAIRHGITAESMRWAFCHVHMGNWQPLTSLSHMVDCELFGLRAGGHHMVNVGLHCLNAMLLFLVLRAMTGAVWRSVFVAALFALHPLHVESVAWVSERKDVLSTLFFILTLWSYWKYVSESAVSSPLSVVQSSRFEVQGSRFRRWIFYGLSLFLFTLGLLSKPMVVTLPFVLLLLDYWPLQRFEFKTQHSKLRTIFPLLLEKVPFVVLAMAMSAVTVLSQYRSQAVETLSYLPIGSRLANAVISYARYLQKMFWPEALAPFYPRVPSWPVWEVIGATVCLIVITLLVLLRGKRQRYLPVGWLWFLATLLPVIGLIQVGAQAMADRYTYIPLIGCFIVVCWGVSDLWNSLGLPKAALGVAGCAVVVACSSFARGQLQHWKDSTTLFSYMLKVMPDSPLAHNNLGSALYHQGKVEEAMTEFQTALRLSPQYDDANNNLGIAEFRRGRNERAIEHFEAVLQKGPNLKALYTLGVVLATEGKAEQAKQCYANAIHLKPDCAEAHSALGSILADQGKPEEAVRHYEAAVQIQPDLAEAQNNLGNLLARAGRADDALAHSLEAARLKPDWAEAHYNVANALFLQNKLAEAETEYSEALRLKANYLEAHQNLGFTLEKLGKDKAAAEQYMEVVRLRPDHAAAFSHLAAVQAKQGKLDEAIKAAEEGLRLANAGGQNQLAAQLRENLVRYRAEKQ